MPCKDNSHAHEWTKSGVLSIAKCETICNFCSSGKEYKPASALRKHVLTHVKNEKLSLLLERSVSGRPKKRSRSPLATTQPDTATLTRSVIEPPAGAATLTNTDVRTGSLVLDAPDQGYVMMDVMVSRLNNGRRPFEACWRCIVFGLECGGRREDSPCSQCLGNDPQPFCSTKTLSMFNFLVLTDDFDFPAELYWQDSRDGLLRVTFAEERDPATPGARQERTLLPFKEIAINALMALSLQHLKINGHLFKEPDSVLRKIVAAASSYKSSCVATKSVISQGLILLSSSLSMLIAVRNFSARWDPYITANAPVADRQRQGVIICEQIPPIKTELEDFLSSLNEQVFSPKLLEAISSEQSDIITVEHAADLLQIFYGILILFITRASLKAIFHSFEGDFHPSARQAMQDPTFDRGWNCPLYQPMLYALGCSEARFQRFLRVLKHGSDIYNHYQTAAHLFPVGVDAFVIEHIEYFFEQFFPPSESNVGSSFSAQLAQLAALPMG